MSASPIANHDDRRDADLRKERARGEPVDAGPFYVSETELMRVADEGHNTTAWRLVEKARRACEYVGGISAPESIEQRVLDATIVDLAEVLQLRIHDCIPRVAFDCAKCAGVAYVLNAVEWSCRRCGNGTRYGLALAILTSPDLLRRADQVWGRP